MARKANGVALDLTTLDWPIRVATSSLGGLGVFSSRRIAAGEAVALEAPLALTPLFHISRQICWWCMEAATGEQPLLCTGCNTACWCSQRCRDAAATFMTGDDVLRTPEKRPTVFATGNAHAHGTTECAALHVWQSAGRPHEDAADLILQAIRLLDVRQRGAVCRPFWPTSSTELGFGSYAARLCGLTRDRYNGDAIRRSAAAALNLVPAAARVGREELEDVLSRQQCNVFGVTGPRGVGHGLASFTGAFQLLNHSCVPNVAFDSRPIVAAKCGEAGPAGAAAAPPVYSLVALRDIGVGEELTHCYASSSEGPAVRQAYLRAHHGFTCACPRCACDDPLRELDISERLDARRCVSPHCGSGLGVHVRGVDAEEGEGLGLRCVHCGEEWEVEEVADLIG